MPKINFQRSTLLELDKIINQGENTFVTSYLYQETQEEFKTEVQDPDEFWKKNVETYVPVSYQWSEGNVVALPSIYDEQGTIFIRWAIVIDNNAYTVLNDIDLFKSNLRGYKVELYSEDDREELGTKAGNPTTAADLEASDPAQALLEVGDYIGCTDTQTVWEVTQDKVLNDGTVEIKLSWTDTGIKYDGSGLASDDYIRYEKYTYNLQLNSAVYNMLEQPFIMNNKRISIVEMTVPYRIFDGRSGTDNTYRIKPLVKTNDNDPDSLYIDIKHITRNNGIGIETSANQNVSTNDVKLSNTSTLFGSDFLIYDDFNFLTRYLYNRTGRNLKRKPDVDLSTLDENNPNRVFTIELNIGGYVYERNVIIDNIQYIDGIAERVMWAVSFKEPKQYLVTQQESS